MMGLTPAQARARFDDIIAFAELEEFLDLKLKNYSSGMQVRLAFSVMVQADADVLLIDEVLAVGDAAFQQKCLDVFHRLRDEGRTIVLVTHDMGAVERFCDRALLLTNGLIDLIGDPTKVGRHYNDLNFGRVAQEQLDGGEPASQRASINEVWVEGDEGERLEAVPHGGRVSIHAALQAHEEVDLPQVNLWLENDGGADPRLHLHASSSVAREPLAPGERARPREPGERPRAGALLRRLLDRAARAAVASSPTSASTSRRWWCTAATTWAGWSRWSIRWSWSGPRSACGDDQRGPSALPPGPRDPRAVRVRRRLAALREPHVD